MILKHSDVNTYCYTPFCYNNIIHSKYAPPGSSTEHMFSYSDKVKNATAKVGGITQSIERKRAPASRRSILRCVAITRAAVNERVCEDSHTEHV